MTYRASKPAASAAVAISASRSRVAAVPPAKPKAPRCRPNRSPAGLSSCRRAAGAASTNAAGTTRTGCGSSTASYPSVGSSSLVAFQARSWPVSTSAGIRFARRRLRSRHSAAGVSKATATHGRSCSRAWASQASRRWASRPSVSITVVSRRACRRRTTSSSTANASELAARSSSPVPTSARRRSLDTMVSGGKWAAAQVDFPAAPGPTSTTTHGDGRFSAAGTRPVCTGPAQRTCSALGGSTAGATGPAGGPRPPRPRSTGNRSDGVAPKDYPILAGSGRFPHNRHPGAHGDPRGAPACSPCAGRFPRFRAGRL